MVSAVKKLAGDCKYDVVSIGYPGLVVHGRPLLEPHNLGPGWVGFDFAAAFKRPVKVINDAADLPGEIRTIAYLRMAPC